jgi:hypothetical protein
MASAASSGAACSPLFDDDPLSSMTAVVCLTRAIHLRKLELECSIAEVKEQKHAFGTGRKLTSQVDRSFRWSDSRGAKARRATAKSK